MTYEMPYDSEHEKVRHEIDDSPTPWTAPSAVYWFGNINAQIIKATKEIATVRLFTTDTEKVTFCDYGFQWDSDISNGAVIFGEEYEENKVAMHDSVGCDFSISRGEVATALQTCIDEFTDGDDIAPSPLHECNGFKVSGLVMDLLNAIMELNQPGEIND